MNKIIFEEARIVDPSQGMDEIGSVIVQENKIIGSGEKALREFYNSDSKRINCKGKTIIPGLVDVSVSLDANQSSHIGSQHLQSLNASCAAGGITSALLSPDRPIIDTITTLEALLSMINQHSLIHIYPTATITRGLQGLSLVDFGLLKERGAIAFSETKTIQNSFIMRMALRAAMDFDCLVFHCPQDVDLASQGLIHEGIKASQLGLSGIPSEAELIGLERDLILAQTTQARYHASKISTALSVSILEQAKKNHSRISASVSINNLLFNDHDIGMYNTAFHLSPPLREEKDRLGLIEGIRNGIIEHITSSHEPQDKTKKETTFSESVTGSCGLETLLPAALRLYHNQDLSLLQIVNALSTAPAKLLGIPAGSLQKNSVADFVLVDLNSPWIFNAENTIFSQKSFCLDGSYFQGKILETWANGKKIYDSCKDVLHI